MSICGKRLAPTLLLVLLGTRLEAQIYTRTNANGVIEATNVPDELGFRLTYPGKGTLIHSLGFRRSYRGEYDHHIDAAAATFRVSVNLIKAVIQVESEFDALAVSSKGAQGLMQLMPPTARRFGVTNPFDVRQNIFGGTQYLRFLLDLFQGDVSLVLAGYNAGENAVTRYRGIPPYRETRNYVQKVRSLLGGFTPVMSYAPATVRATYQQAPRGHKIIPARPRVYYKYVDGGGVLHVSQQVPPEGVTYSMLRVTD
jgi:hypothetical protein